MGFCNITSILEKRFQASVNKSFELDDSVEITKATKASFGDYQCNSALKLAKLLKKSPREVAETINKNIDNNDQLILRTEIAGPGFINIHLNPTVLSTELNQIFDDPHLGAELPEVKQRIICEFSSPNIAKQMHVGHLRSTIIGDSLARLLEFLGHDVLRLNHVGDWGTQFGMLIYYLKIFHPKILEDTPEGTNSASLAELMHWYRESKKKFDESETFKKAAQEEVVKIQAKDPESMKAWERICAVSRRDFSVIYELLDVKIEERGESFYNPYLAQVVQDFKNKDLAKIDGGATCVFLDGFKNKEGDPLPLIIQKRDGGYNYSTTDLAGFKYRAETDKASRIIIVTDSGQSMHFKMVYNAAKLVGYIDAEQVEFNHVPFGLVLTPNGQKYKTRSGETEKLIDLLDEAIIKAKKILEEREKEHKVENIPHSAKVLGISAVKYADLSCNRIKDYVFSYERMLQFEGNTAAFILYAYVRIQSIKRKSNKDVEAIKSAKIDLQHPSEIALGTTLRTFGEALTAMDKELLPNKLTDYLYHLAEKFNAFFRDCPVLNNEHELSRLKLCELTGRILHQGLSILGIQTLDRM